MTKNLTKILTLTILMTTLVMTGCGDNHESTSHAVYNNEEDAVVFAITDLDGVFNPFYSSSGNDSNIVGMTQISMFTTKGEGELAYGADEAALVYDYSQHYDATADQTTYTFVLKNPSYNPKFSNGSYITLRDVLFNMYEYLDPQYLGSATMYSTDILGVKEYRTQQDTEEGQKAFDEKFALEAEERVRNLVTVIAEIEKENPNIDGYDEYVAALQKKETDNSGNASQKYADKYVEDFEFISSEFKDELKSDFTANKDTYDDVFSPTPAQKAADEAAYGDNYTLYCDVQTFLYAEGLITIDLDKDKTDETRIKYSGFDMATLAEMEITQEKAIQIVYDTNFPSQFAMVANYWQTANKAREQFVAEAKEAYFTENTERKYKDISGIKVITEDTMVNDKLYHYALYNSDGSKLEGSDNGYEMFSITIKGVDPKAIWNFSFSVSPMYYYSNAEEIAKFNYGLPKYMTNNADPAFGVAYGSQTFQLETIKGGEKVGLPMGGGAYKAATRDAGAPLNKSTFYDSNVVYFERNENFMMGTPKIKKIRYQITSTNQMLNALKTGLVHYCEPSAKKEIIDELNGLSSQGYSYATARTLGYGYIGINARFIESIYARRALMTTFNAKYSVDYYSGEAETLLRPMSKVSWAYPTNAEPYYEYDSTGQAALAFFRQAGYTQNSKGLLVDKDGKQFKVKFTIAGEDADHPTANVFYQSQRILQNIGCDVEVEPDVDALSKLNSGDLAVWAAAWSTTIDPDMYQTYHIDSTATSTLNWGYNLIKNDTAGRIYGEEKRIIAELSEKIEAGRKTLDQRERTEIYADCLDLVMELAVEFPVYQRNDLFAYNSNFLDTRTMTPKNEVTPYNGPINKIWELSLVTE